MSVYISLHHCLILLVNISQLCKINIKWKLVKEWIAYEGNLTWIVEYEFLYDAKEQVEIHCIYNMFNFKGYLSQYILSRWRKYFKRKKRIIFFFLPKILIKSFKDNIAKNPQKQSKKGMLLFFSLYIYIYILLIQKMVFLNHFTQ